MNNSDKYIIDTFFDSIKQTKEDEPFLYKILNNEFVDEFYIELYDKLKYNYISKTDLKFALKKNVIDVYNIIIKRKDIFDKIINQNIKLIDLTDSIKRNLILKDERQVNLPHGMFKSKTASESLKEKLFINKSSFHPSQLEKRKGKVQEETDKKKVEKFEKVEKDLSVLFGDKKKPEEIKKLAEKLVEQQPDRVKSINIKLIEDLVKEIPKKEKKIKLVCKDGKILNKFTNKCVSEDSAVGIFMKSKNAKLDEITKEDLHKYTELKIAELKKLCKTNAPNINCDDMETKKQLYEHIFNNFNIHNNKLLCEDGKVYYKDTKECVDKREYKLKEKKTSKTSKTSNKLKLSPRRFKNVDDKIRQQIKENLKKKNPINCKEDEVYNKFTDKCVKKNTTTGSFLMSNYGNLNTVTKNDLKNFNKLKREDLDNLCKKYSHIGCNFNTKEELARHILDNVRLDKNELFCEDNKVYYHNVKKCTERKLTKSEKQKKQKEQKELDKGYSSPLNYNKDEQIYAKYTKMLIKNAYDSSFIDKNNYKGTNEQVFKMIQFIHQDIIKKLKKQLKDSEIRKNVEKSKDFYEKLIKDVYNTYYNKLLITDQEMKDFIRENIFVNVSDYIIDKIYKFIFRDIIIQLLFENELTINKKLNLNFTYKLSPEITKKVAILKYSPKKSLTPDLKKSEKIKTIEDIVLDMISKGNKYKLIGNKIKKNTTVNYITKLLENMKKSFYKMLDKNKVILTDENKKYYIDKFITENINDKIDTISNNLISSCLSEMTLENSRFWLNSYLPIAFNQIV